VVNKLVNNQASYHHSAGIYYQVDIYMCVTHADGRTFKTLRCVGTPVRVVVITKASSRDEVFFARKQAHNLAGHDKQRERASG
jgi:hypothetical protein